MEQQKEQSTPTGAPGQFQVKAGDEILKGAYANMVQVGHTPEEFILDFMNVFPPAGMLTSRVIVSPAHMKRICAALAENLKSYEQQFGAISDKGRLSSGGKGAAGQVAPTTTSSSDHKFGFDTTSAK